MSRMSKWIQDRIANRPPKADRIFRAVERQRRKVATDMERPRLL